MILLPPELRHLYESDGPEGVEFRANLRHYNSAFSMTSFGTSVRHQRVDRRPDHPIIIQGQVYHLIGPLEPEPGQAARFLQIYFLEPRDSVQSRLDVLRMEGNPTQRGIMNTCEQVFARKQ